MVCLSVLWECSLVFLFGPLHGAVDAYKASYMFSFFPNGPLSVA